MNSMDVKLPNLGEGADSGVVVNVFVKEGDQIARDQPILELENEKAVASIPSPVSGTVAKLRVKVGDKISVGQLILSVSEDSGAVTKASDTKTAVKATEDKVGADQAPVPPEEAIDKHEAEPAHSQRAPVAAPSIRKIARELGIDLAKIHGTERGGRIVLADLRAYLQRLQKLAAQPTPGRAATPPAATAERIDFSKWGEITKKPMSALRKTISRRLVEAKNTTAMLTTFNEVDMKPIMDLRTKYKEVFNKKHGVNLGFMSFFTKAACFALKEWPSVNAYIDGDSIIYHDYCDISIAVSAPRGLVVPVIRNAESLSMAEIEKKVVELATKAKESKLTIEEMTGGTFTITNGGVFGSLMSTPIINIPQSAILGMHKIQERPMAVNGQVVIKPMMYLALSYDHRIIDGRESVSFLVRVKELLETPELLLVGKDPLKALLGL